MFINQTGGEEPEVKTLFQKPWFEEFIKHVLWSIFTGVKVIEIFKLDENLELYTAELIPMEHTNPKKGLILKEPGQQNGQNYKTGNLENFYLQIGKDYDIGTLAEITPLVLAKKLAMGSWLDFIEKFGIPPRIVTTDNNSTERQDELLDMMLKMVNNHVAVLNGTEKIEIPQTPNTDAYKVFNEMIARLNSEMSKRILGQDGTSDNKDTSGNYGSLKILQEVANDRHESDKLFVKYIINSQLIPRLIILSSVYAPLNNLTFDWDTSEEIEKGTMVDKAVALTNAGFELDHQILAEKTGMPITGIKKPIEQEKDGNDPKKKN